MPMAAHREGMSTPTPGDDSSLVARALAGDPSAYAGLLSRHRSRVLGLALRMVRNADDAADIAQEAFLRAFQSLAGFDPGKSFGAWIAKITANLCIDHYRRRRLRTVSLDGSAEEGRGDRGDHPWEFADARPGPEAILVHNESERRLDDLIASLPPRYRMVILLRYKEDLAYEEIAAVLGVPLGTVKARLHRAHHMLKRRLGPIPRGAGDDSAPG
jgi:RNA polymerase sigma-70 factor (ECF subfamily)